MVSKMFIQYFFVGMPAKDTKCANILKKLTSLDSTHHEIY
jgi:hypothetical protein